MQLLLFALIAVAAVMAMGIGVAAAISTLPLAALERVFEKGRYSGLGAQEPQSRGTPAAGMPVSGALVEPGYAG